MESLLDSSSTFSNLYDKHATLAADESTRQNFWAEQAKAIDWYKEPETILREVPHAPFYEWFNGGVLNMSYNCLDRHVKKDPSLRAIIYDNAFDDPRIPSKEYTYSEVLDIVSRLAGVLSDMGVKKGDVVMIYMPNIPEAAFSILACARIGAIHWSVYDSFIGNYLAEIIKTFTPKVILLASCSLDGQKKPIDLHSNIINALKANQMTDVKRLVVQREIYKVELIQGEELDFYSEISKAQPRDPVPMNSNDPLSISNTSGTTGPPKGLVHNVGPFAVSSRYGFWSVFNLKKGDVFFSLSTTAWMIGLIYNLYGCLLNGVTSMFFEGTVEHDPTLAWRLCEKHKVTAHFSYPSTLRSIKKRDPRGDSLKSLDLSSLKLVNYGGERDDIPTHEWLKENLPKTCSVNNMYGQSESAFALTSSYQALHVFPEKQGSCNQPAPGTCFKILGTDNTIQPPNQPGKVCIKLPLPPSFAWTYYKSPKEFHEKYFAEIPGYYYTGDTGYLDEEGYVFISGRENEVIIWASYKLNAAQVQISINGHPDVIESAVTSGPDEFGTEIPVSFLVLRKGAETRAQEIVKECIEKAKSDIGSFFDFHCCIVVDELPKLKNRKLLKRLLKDMLYGKELEIPGNILNADVLENIKQKIKEFGFNK